MDKDFLPLLARGEEYIEFESSRRGIPPGTDKLSTYEEARNKLQLKLEMVKEYVKKIPDEHRVSDVIVNLQMAVGYTAKSYYPINLISLSGATDVGSKNQNKVEKNKKGKEKLRSWKNVFLRMSEEHLSYFSTILNQKEDLLTKGFIADVRKVEDFYIRDTNQILGAFSPDWEAGRVEFVLHPFGELEGEVIQKFCALFERSGGDIKTVKYKSYFPGPVFVSGYCNKEVLGKLVYFNPLRAAHPLKFTGVPINSKSSSLQLPKVPQGNTKSSIVVGMFDGGIIEQHPFLQNYVKEYNPVGSLPSADCLAHGTGVAGAILYGNLKGYDASATLPTPAISVESYRVLPLSNPLDYDLYEVIDIIEEVVPKRSDIKVYNLSLGPEGAIDNEISRFTHALDSLSEKGDKLFCVAVGNDGDLPNEESRRIQAPADLVNGLGVGAYTYDVTGKKIERALYSSIGEGREGCKVKPDVMAFGGSEKHPFYLLGADGSTKFLANGTSFASPLIASRAAELVGRCNVADPLVARALIIHSAKHPDGSHDRYLGYGVVPETIEEILGCKPNKVTVLYKQRILPKKYAKVKIPFLEGLSYQGNVKIDWTIAIATKTNPNHPDDYTKSCIEDTFYPSEQLYCFTDPESKKTKMRHLMRDSLEIETLLSQGWIKSTNPCSASGNQYQNEDERRKINFKWDTVVKKWKTFRYNSIDSPYLVLHSMDRGLPENYDFIDYAIVISVEYVNYGENAYEETIKNYPKLETARLKSMNEVFVR